MHFNITSTADESFMKIDEARPRIQEGINPLGSIMCAIQKGLPLAA
jgi:hypothetical protein